MERQRIEWPLVSIAQVRNHIKVLTHKKSVDYSDGHISADYVGDRRSIRGSESHYVDKVLFLPDLAHSI